MGWFDKLTTSGQQPKPLVLSLSKDPLRDGLIAELISTDRLMGNDKFRKGGQESPPLAKACPEPAEWGDLGGFPDTTRVTPENLTATPINPGALAFC